MLTAGKMRGLGRSADGTRPTGLQSKVQAVGVYKVLAWCTAPSLKSQVRAGILPCDNKGTGIPPFIILLCSSREFLKKTAVLKCLGLLATSERFAEWKPRLRMDVCWLLFRLCILIQNTKRERE